jgi:2'-deoxymugineic-acid 2'-dioxygenase / mugineic-acid 3-dioxygenase
LFASQVVNHGVPEQLLRDMEAVCDEFYYELPAAEKAHLYSEDKQKPNRLFSGTTYETGGHKYWMDCLRLAFTFPVGDSTSEWPHKPHRLR